MLDLQDPCSLGIAMLLRSSNSLVPLVKSRHVSQGGRAWPEGILTSVLMLLSKIHYAEAKHASSSSTYLDKSLLELLLQGREDARMAVQWYRDHIGRGDAAVGLACAHLRQGQAFMAKPDHADRDAVQAAKV